MLIILIFFGLCLGSFVNAFVYRLYENDKDLYYGVQNTKSKKKEVSKKLSIWNGRSICVNCKHKLSALDLIPLISWIYLRGKCRYCKKPISWQYPLVELTTALLFTFSYIYWPQNLNSSNSIIFVFWCIYLVGFMALVVFDLRWYLLPDKIVFGLYFVYLVQLLFMIFIDGISTYQTISSTLGALTISLFFWMLFRISNGAWIGGGDVKLGLLLGALVGGVLESLLVIFIASLLGSIIGGIYLMFAKRFRLKAQLPFGPYLISATILVVLFGERLIELYRKLLLI